jgi:hypothetical protein
VLARDDFRQFAGVLEHEVAEREHHARAAGQGRIAPLAERLARGRNRRINVFRFGEQDVGLLLAGRRIPHRSGPSRGPVCFAAADGMRNGFEQRFHTCIRPCCRALRIRPLLFFARYVAFAGVLRRSCESDQAADNMCASSERSRSTRSGL